MTASIFIRYADVACPRCGAGPLRSCHTVNGYDYQYRYTHAARRHTWWARHRNVRTTP